MEPGRGLLQLEGVGCDASGRVTILDLDNEAITSGADNLTSLFRLQFLEILDLGFNYFDDSPIPKAIANLTNLVHLSLSNSNFGGQIPIELSSLRNLVSLDLSTVFYKNSSMKLENPTLKMLLQNLSNIEEIYLDGVDLSAQGSDWFQVIETSLPKLRILSLVKCSISWPIHVSLSSTRINNLTDVYLDYNNISGEVPEFFANMPNLRTLSLSSCNLLGQFPVKIFQVPALQTLDISDNKLLQGSLPPFPENSSLTELLISSTSFSGSLPSSIGNLHNLSSIYLSHNSFSGPVPQFRASKTLLTIDLSSNNLTGSLSSAHFEGLESLGKLDLRRNFLSGILPLSIFKLPALGSISLSNNQFSGQIDEIPHRLSMPWAGLTSLDVRSNQFNGSFPKFLFELKQLTVLLLSANSFTDTIQLETFKNLPFLGILDLSHNNLTVEIQSYNSSLANIIMLRLASCMLKTVPEIKSSTVLNVLDLSVNEITGEIPNWIWNMGRLYYLNLSLNSFEGLQQPYNISTPSILDLHSNQLKGEVPIVSSILRYVDFSQNNFIGTIPSNLNTASFMSLSNNSLTGSIPDSLCNATNLQVLDFSYNDLSGIIPSCLVESATLDVLNLAGNNLNGSIPDTFPAKCSLKTLDLGSNQFQGKLPRTLSDCTRLEVLNLGNNKIEDAFPCMFESSSSLQILILRSNKFSGELECFGNNYGWPNLQIIDIASNNFSGVLSSHFFSSLKKMLTLAYTQESSRVGFMSFMFSSISVYEYQFKVRVTMKGLELELEKILTIFTTINFSNNKFSGKIPESIGDLEALYVLDLSHNEITGGIPSSIAKLKNLGSLDLSRNQLTGEIPSALQDLTFLSYLNLSFNILTGKIPTGSQFQTYTMDSYIGNVGLCGFPLNVSCGDANKTGSSSMHSSHNKKEIDWMYISASLGYTVGLGIFVVLLLFSERWRNKLFLQVDQLLAKVFSPEWREPIRAL